MRTLAPTAIIIAGALATSAGPALAAEAAMPAMVAKGDTAWILISAILVIAMTIPGLALFYGGLVRARNVLSVLMQGLAGFSMISLLWFAYGYSLAFTGAGTAGEADWLTPFFGGFEKAFLAGIGPESLSATFSPGVFIPELSFVIFQLAFATIAAVLIIGATVERMKFAAVMVFLALWFTFAYLPMAHMVWWAGSGAEGAPSGYLFALGALDFAGGTVVHINAGIAALVAAIMVGRRTGFGRENMAPHDLPLTMIGASLLWVGWFGFNAGSALEANGLAAVAALNTVLAAAAATLTWPAIEALRGGRGSLLGAISGTVAGLVAITPAAGFAGHAGAVALGAAASAISYGAVVWLKPRLGHDDSLDVFGIHGVAGIVGALSTGIVGASTLGGFGGFTDIAGQLVMQAQAVAICIVWAAVVSAVALALIDRTIGLRVSEAEEREGLDLACHGERAYGSPFSGHAVPFHPGEAAARADTGMMRHENMP